MRNWIWACGTATACVVTILGATATGCGGDDCDFGLCGVAPGVDGSVMDGQGDVGSTVDHTNPGEGGKDGAAEEDTGGCNKGGSVSDTPCVVDNAFGVFVSGNGNDANGGTKDAPVKTILEGIKKAKDSQRSRVLVCAGTYTDNVVLDTSSDGILISGGLDCSTWTYGLNNKVTVKPASGYALELKSLTKGTVIEDMALESSDATSAGASSIAVFVNGSKAGFVRVSVKAGTGRDGVDGVAIGDFSGAAPSGGAGSIANGGASVSNTSCVSAGGSGGGPNALGADGNPGTPTITPADPQNATGAGGLAASGDCGAGSSGRNGSMGAAGTGAAGASAPGVLSANGWAPAAGGNGTSGGIAQGGGGGASLAVASGGGGGGPGGCGGTGGNRGTGGGASVGIMGFQSTLSLSATAIQSSSAGKGGNGGAGQKGQQGSAAGGTQAGTACQGGLGGHGGSGGGGGGGAGGLSVGILYKGTAPTIDGNAVEAAATHAKVTVSSSVALGGLAGAGGPAVVPTNPRPSHAGNPGTAGQAGESKAVIKIP